VTHYGTLIRAVLALWMLGAPASVGAAQAAWLPVLLDFPQNPSTAVDIDNSGRIAVLGPDASDEKPYGEILLPPHPGGGKHLLPCYAWPVCTNQQDFGTGLARSGWILGRKMFFDSGGPPNDSFSAAFDPSGCCSRDMEFHPYMKIVHGNSDGVLVGLDSHLDDPLPPFLLWHNAPFYWPVGGDRVELPSIYDLMENPFEWGPIPTRINDAGAVVGHEMWHLFPDPLNFADHASIWRPPSYPLEYLGELPGGSASRALGIDSSGRVVGSSDDGSAEVAVHWSRDGAAWNVSPLPVPLGFATCSEATAVNDQDQIAGNCTTPGGQTRGIIWQSSSGTWEFAQQLDPLAGDAESAVFGINESGWAVGRSGSAASARAVLWAVGPSVPAASPPLIAFLSLLIGGVAIALLSENRRRHRMP
jgi:hypothetical protein